MDPPPTPLQQEGQTEEWERHKALEKLGGGSPERAKTASFPIPAVGEVETFLLPPHPALCLESYSAGLTAQVTRFPVPVGQKGPQQLCPGSVLKAHPASTCLEVPSPLNPSRGAWEERQASLKAEASGIGPRPTCTQETTECWTGVHGKGGCRGGVSVARRE